MNWTDKTEFAASTTIAVEDCNRPVWHVTTQNGLLNDADNM